MLIQFELATPTLVYNRPRPIERLLKERFGAGGGGYAAVLHYLQLGGRALTTRPPPAVLRRALLHIIPSFKVGGAGRFAGPGSFFSWLRLQATGQPYSVLLGAGQRPLNQKSG
jgi:hypothetical protein